MKIINCAVAVLGLLAASSAVSFAADAAPPKHGVVCVLTEFVPQNGSGRGVYANASSDYTPPMSAAAKQVLNACLKNYGPSGRGFIIPMPYLASAGPDKWTVEVAFCNKDRSAFVVKGTMSPKKSDTFRVKDMVASGNRYCR